MPPKKYSIQTGINNPILRAHSEEIFEITEDIKQFCTDMIKLMRKNKWVGLAAPQVGRNLRIIITTQWDIKNKEEKFLWETIMINPIIIEISKDTVVWEEACISIPDVLGNVRRQKSLVIEYLDIKGNKQKKKLKDFNAVIVQHEIDHLDWILFTDKLIKSTKNI